MSILIQQVTVSDLSHCLRKAWFELLLTPFVRKQAETWTQSWGRNHAEPPWEQPRCVQESPPLRVTPAHSFPRLTPTWRCDAEFPEDWVLHRQVGGVGGCLFFTALGTGTVSYV